MADLDAYKDKVIVFEAVKTSETNRLATRQPLQPTNTQMPSSPRLFSHKPASIKTSIDGVVDENNTQISGRAVHGQSPHAAARSNFLSSPRSPDHVRQAPGPPSHASGSTFQSSTLPHSSVKINSSPHSDATASSSTSENASGSVSMTGFDRYHAY